MDYGYLDDQYHLAVHEVDALDARERLKLLPAGFDPYEGHYEETEKDHINWFSGAGRKMAGEIPPEFGTLSHVNPKNGKYHLRYFYGTDLSLEADLGRGRARPSVWEAYKFNQRLNPVPNRVGNYAVHNTNPPRTEDDMKESGEVVKW